MGSIPTGRTTSLEINADTHHRRGLAGVRVREAYEAKRLAIVLEPTRLRSLPVLGGEAGAPVLTGEVARTVRAEGVWSLVRLADDREGWMATDQLEPIARPWSGRRR